LSAEPLKNRVRRSFTPSQKGTDVLVIGLGRFGSTLARELELLGHRVMGVDVHEDIVRRYKDAFTDVVQSDTTTEEALRQLGAPEFDTAVVAIGTSVEDSVLTTLALVDIGIPNLWARAINDAHEKILQRVGAANVVQPDRDEALRVAHRVLSGKMMDFLSLDENFALVEVAAPFDLIGRSLESVGVRRKYGVTVVCIKPAGGVFTYATPDTVVGEGDILVVAGSTGVAERFALLPGPSRPVSGTLQP
jgi:trk system potassium uptake protein